LLPEWDIAIKEVEAAMDRHVKPLILGYFNRIVSSWRHAPVFKARKSITKKEIVVYIYPTGPNADIWKWVSVTGTKPHPIPVSNAEWLMFIWGGPGSYKARTNLSGGYKGPGLPSGTWRKMKVVQHPGFPPRNFEKWVSKWASKRANRIVGNAFRRGFRKARAASRSL
jgi:hypothetical protein